MEFQLEQAPENRLCFGCVMPLVRDRPVRVEAGYRQSLKSDIGRHPLSTVRIESADAA